MKIIYQKSFEPVVDMAFKGGGKKYANSILTSNIMSYTFVP